MSDLNKTDSASEPRRKVGDILRDTRVVRDEELKDAAKALAIRLPFMEAIEDSRPSDLPGAAYALGFVRSYADYLGLDSKALVERYKEEAKELEQETLLNFPEPLPSRRVPMAALLFIGIILALLFYGVWWYLNNQGKNLSDIVQNLNSNETATSAPVGTSVKEEVASAPAAPKAIEPVKENAPEVVVTETVAPETAAPETITTETSTPASMVAETKVEDVVQEVADDAVEVVESQQTVTETAPIASVEEPVAEATAAVIEEVVSTAPTTSDAVSETIATTEATNPTTIETTPTVVEDAVEETAAPTSPSTSNERETRIYGEENTNSRVTLLAVESAWVEVSNPAGDLTLTRLLRKGDRYLVPNKPGLTMVTGNAGGIMIVVDGKEIEAAGPIGAVRRDYLLDADRFLQVTSPAEDMTSDTPTTETSGTSN